MFKEHLKITWRNILKHKGYSFINILGLAMGMAVCILIFSWVQDELSFDRFHKNADQIYRVVEDQVQSNGEITRVAITPWAIGAAFVKDYPEIINFTRFLNIGRILITYKSRSGDKSFYENGICVADPSFLEIFSFPLIKGDPSTALSKGHRVVITEDTAKKYFGNEDPMGKTLLINNRYDLVVTGILKNIPRNSHITFDFLINFEQTLQNAQDRGSFFSNAYYTFVHLQKNADVETLGEKIYDYLYRINPHTSLRFRLQPLTDMHLRSEYKIDLYGVSKDTFSYIYIFSIVAILILLIACINFVNLTIARASTRTQEVGMRKVVGASRKDLIAQFFGESIFLTIISLIFALILAYLLLPLFNNLAGKELTLNPFTNSAIGLGLLLIAIIAGMTAGIYPALVQSAFQPINVIRGNLSSKTGKPGGGLFRKVLVIFQFTLSIALIICTLVVNRQLDYIHHKELGYEKNNIIYFTREGNIGTKYDAFKEELLKNSNIQTVTTSSDVPIYTLHSTIDFDWEGKPLGTVLLVHHFSVHYDYFNIFKMKILEGRDFSKDFPTDATGTAYIVNEAAVKAMNMKDPVGKKLSLYSKEGPIIGVVKDFHYKSLHNKIEPLVLRIEPKNDWYIFVKLRAGSNIPGTLNDIKEVYQQFNPQHPMIYHFLDEQLDQLYDNDKRTFRIFQYATFIAIFLSCLGLFGLAAFTAQMRTREIGIRKVVGASVPNIILMLSKETLYLVVAANILAWPIAYLTMSKWLQSFVYRTSIVLATFILSALVAVFIALCTVIYHSIKAANTNPVDVIRYE